MQEHKSAGVYVESGRTSTKARGDSSEAKISSALSELFTMKNKLDDEDDISKDDPVRFLNGNNKPSKSLLGKGDVANVLNQFRESRSKELKEERERQRHSMKEALFSTHFASEEFDDEAAESSNDYDIPQQNRFYDEYAGHSKNVVDKKVATLQTIETPETEEIAANNNNGRGLKVDVSNSHLNTASNTTPPLSPSENMQGQFYQYVRSPKSNRKHADEPSGKCCFNSDKDVNLTSANDAAEADIEAGDSLMSGLSSQDGGELWGADVINIGEESTGTRGTLTSNGETRYQLVADSPNGGLAFNTGAVSISSEPAVDREAFENTLRNQVMLYESSQQLQLGGAVSSWALGGSVESLGVNFTLEHQGLDGSIDKLTSSLERAAGDLGRSVTFANKTDVREFENDPSELLAGMELFSRGSRLEDEEGPPRHGPSSKFYIPPFKDKVGSHDAHAAPSAASKLRQDALSEETNDDAVAPIRFPDNYSWQHDGEDNKLNNSIDEEGELGYELMNSANDLYDSEFNGLDGEKGIILDEEFENAARDLGENGNIKSKNTQKNSGNAPSKVKAKQVSTFSHRVEMGKDETLKEEDSSQVYYAGKDNQKIITPPGSPPQPLKPRPSQSSHSTNPVRLFSHALPKELIAEPIAQLIAKEIEVHVAHETISAPVERAGIPVVLIAANEKVASHRKPTIPVSKTPFPIPIDHEAIAERRCQDQERIDDLSRPVPDKSVRPGRPPRSSVDCPNIPFDRVDELQMQADTETMLQGTFDPSTTKVRIVLRAQVPLDDNFRDLLKKLPRQKKQYGLSEMKVFRDKTDVLEPQQIINCLFGGNSSAWSQQKTKQKLWTSTSQASSPICTNSAKSAKKRLGSPKRQLPTNFSGGKSNIRSGLESTYVQAEMNDFRGEKLGQNGSIFSGQSVGPFGSQHFLRRFSHGFTCVALDFYMNIMGTFDMASGLFMPGLDFDPRIVAKSPSCTADILATVGNVPIDWRKTKERPSMRQANVLEIDFSTIPRNVFALVPIIFDESIPNVIKVENDEKSNVSRERGDISNLIQGMKFDCVMYSCVPATKQDYEAAEADMDRPEQATVVAEINGMEKFVTDSLRTNFQAATDRVKYLKKKDQEQMLKRHLAGIQSDDESFESRESGAEGVKDEFVWKSQCNMMYSRSSNVAEKYARRASCLQVSNDILQTIPLGLREAFIPMVLYRRSTAQKGWGWKSLKTVTKGLQSSNADHVLNTILESLVKTNVMPFHAIHVEHCDNCEAHAMSTRHAPGNYKQQYVDMKKSLHAEIPQLVCQNNLQSMLAEDSGGSLRSKKANGGFKEPRVGAFEVVMRPYCSSVSQLIYSKLATHCFPKPADLINVMSGYLRPVPSAFSDPPTLDVIIFGKASKRPMPDLDVVVYRVEIDMKGSDTKKPRMLVKSTLQSTTNGILEITEEGSDDSESSGDEGNKPLGGTANLAPSIMLQGGADEDSETDAVGTDPGEKRTKVSIARKGFQIKSRRELGKGAKLSGVSQSVIQDPLHSAVGSWGRRDVLAWFESHKVSQDVRFFAEQAGVISGHALLKHVNEKNLRTWGCNNKRVLQSILLDIDRMRDAISHDNPDKVGLSNHRIQHMLETSNLMGKSMGVNNSIAPQSGLNEFALGSSSMLKSIKSEREAQRNAKTKSLSDFNQVSVSQLLNSVKKTKIGKNMNLITVASGKTSVIGMIRCRLDRAGSYLVKVSSPKTVPIWSHILSLGVDAEHSHLLWASKIESKFGLIRVQLSATVYSFVMTFGDYVNNGVIIPFTNMETQRQHLVYLHIKDTAATDNETDALVKDVFLPVGKYFANICGTVINVSTTIQRHGSHVASNSVRTLKYLEKEDVILRHHNRVVRVSANKVQECRRHLRHMRASRLTHSLLLGLRIRVVMRAYLKRARARLLPRRITRIQTAWRRYSARAKYVEAKRRAAKLKAIALYERKKIARQNWSLATVFVRCFLKLTTKLHSRRLQKLRKSTICIQSVWRRKKAYKTVALQRKLRSISFHCLFVFKTRILMKIMRRRKQRELEKQTTFKEGKNMELMAAEEAYARNYIILLAEAEAHRILMDRKRTAEALRQIEMRKMAYELRLNKTAIFLQAWARGCDVRNWGDLYVAKARGLIHSVHGGRPVRRFMYDSDSVSEVSGVTGEFTDDPSVTFVQRSMHNVKSSFMAVRRKLAVALNTLINRKVSQELAEGRQIHYGRKRTYDPVRLMAVRRQSLMYKLPGVDEASSAVSEDDESEEQEPEIQVSAFRRYVYAPDIISAETKVYANDVKNKIKLKATNISKKAKNAIRATPRKVVETVGAVVALTASGILQGSHIVGLAGVRGLRSVKKHVKARQFPSVSDMKIASLDFVRNSIDLPKTIVVQSGILRLKSRDLKHMTRQQRRQHAVTILQSSWRGYSCRMGLLRDPVYRAGLAELVRIALESEQERKQAAADAAIIAASEAESAAAVLAESAVAADAALSLKEQKRMSRKVDSKTSTNGLKLFVANAKGLLQDAATKATSKVGDFVARKRNVSDREARRANSMLGLNDALLQVAGTLSHCPSLDRQWHIGIYPKGTVINQGWFGSLRNVNTGGADRDTFNTGVAGSRISSTRSGSGVPSDNKVQSKDKDEHLRSVSAYPLNKQTFAAASFNVHLADLTRYHELEIAIFVETLGVTYTPPAGTLPNAPFDADNSPSLSTNSFFFAPAFIATINIGGGGAFSPSGGRMHIKLRPNPSVVGRLPQAKKFLNMDGLGVVITLLPTALPPSSFLRSFRGHARPAPCYPSCLVDATLLDGCSIDWNGRNGGATSVGSFRDRLLVATSARGTGVGVHEYANTGAYIGQIVDIPFETMGDITSILSGLHHVVFCSNSGKLMIMEYSRGDSQSSSNYNWSKPFYVLSNEARRPIASGCMTSHAGMDVLFTADRSGAVNVAVISGGICVRSYHNENFVYPAHIICMAVCSLRLYLGCSDGTMTVISLYNILEEGSVDMASNLEDFVISRDACFHPEAGITCLCVVSGNNFLGFCDEDELSRSEGDPKKPKRVKKDGALEGHLLLVGGGDADPTVKVLQPQSKGMRLLSTLSGHTRGITTVASDAAGRHFFTLSADDHSVLAWDGFTFRQERRIVGELFVRGLGLADDCLLVISDKAPFLKFWRVRVHELVRQSSNEESVRFVDSKLGAERAQLEHDAENLTVASVRNQDWCRERLLGVLRKSRTCALLRAAPDQLDESQRQQVVYRWLTQYTRIEIAPTLRPAFFSSAPSASSSPDSVSNISSHSRAKARREAHVRSLAEKSVNNFLPGSPVHTAGLKILAELKDQMHEDEFQEEEEEVLEVSDRKLFGSTFGSREKINMAKEGVNRDMQKSIDNSKKSRLAFGKEPVNGKDDDDYTRLFPGLSPVMKKKQDVEMAERKKDSEAEIARARVLHRLNVHAHFSDSDEEEDKRILYVKPIKLTKAEMRMRNKDEKGQQWTKVNSQPSPPGNNTPQNGEKKKISTAVLISSPSPEKTHSFQVYYEEDARESLVMKSAVDLWQQTAKKSIKTKDKGFYRSMVRNLRDIDIDDE